MTQAEQTGEYIPGICNIGKAETARRRNFGWIALAVTVALLALLIGLRANPRWRLLIFFPAMMSASGFLQARFHFCSGFANKGVFNFGSPGNTQQVADEASRQKDRRTGNRITFYAALIGLAAAIILSVI